MGSIDPFKNLIEIQKLQKQLKATSGNLVKYDFRCVAEKDGQTEFQIPMTTFDYSKDTVMVFSGRVKLSAIDDQVLVGTTVILTEGVPLGRTIDILVFKSVVTPDEEVALSGVNIAKGTIPLDRMMEEIPTKEYVDEEINKIPINGKVQMYTRTQTATTNGQTNFEIPFETYDSTTDSLKVYLGQLCLHRDLDFVVSSDNKVVLTEGVSAGTTITMDLFKQIETSAEENFIHGGAIRVGTIPLDRLEESVGGNLTTIKEHYVATEGQTIFPIAYETFDNTKDDLTVVSGVITLTEDYDYTVEGQNIVFVSPVAAGRTVHIKILKNVKTDKVEETFSGVYVEKGTMPVDRLVENVVTCDIPMHMSVGEDGGVQIKYTGLLYETIEYIESTGEQYIDTGFTPNQDTRVVCEAMLEVSGSTSWLFGTRTSADSNDRFCFNASNSGCYNTLYDSTKGAFPSELNTYEKMVVDKNKNITTINGDNAVTATYTEFISAYELPLFACNTGGLITCGIARLYSCQIYDGDVLVRDFIPVKTPNGVACLYDKVSGIFYYNKGTGEFISGAEL